MCQGFDVKQKGKKSKRSLSRRDFIKTSAGAGTATIVGIAAIGSAGARSAEPEPQPAVGLPEPEPAAGKGLTSQYALDPDQELAVRANFPIGNPGALPHTREASEQAAPKVNRLAVLFAIGDTLIPSAPGDPGYRDLEWYGITEEVSRRLEELPDADVDYFNRSCLALYEKAFTELPESKRVEYFDLILKGEMKDQARHKKLKEIYSHARELIYTVYYQNFPEDRWPRDARRVPLLRPGDEHQITNPNTAAVVTGWDLGGYAGPLTWEEEERRRNYFKKIRWQE